MKGYYIAVCSVKAATEFQFFKLLLECCADDMYHVSDNPAYYDLLSRAYDEALMRDYDENKDIGIKMIYMTECNRNELKSIVGEFSDPDNFLKIIVTFDPQKNNKSFAYVDGRFCMYFIENPRIKMLRQLGS